MRRITVVCVLSFVLLSLSASIASASNRASDVFPSIPGGYAYVGLVITSGSTSFGSSHDANLPIGQISTSCTAVPVDQTNGTAGISLAPVMSSGIGQDEVKTDRGVTSSTAQSLTTIHNVNLLQGLITADTVRAMTSSTNTFTGATSTDSGSTFVGLRVDGVPVMAPPRPNTTLNLPGFGYVVLHEQDGPVDSSTTTSISINMIDVYITSVNTLGVPVGTRIIVAHAGSYNQSTAQPAIVSALAYRAYSTGVGLSSSTSVGAPAPAEIGCDGGNSQNSASASPSSSVGSMGATRNTASGQIGSSNSSASAQVTVSDVNLLKGAIQARSVTTLATAVWNGTGAGSIWTNLEDAVVAGTPISQSPPPNTRVNIPGLGYAMLNEQYWSVSSSGALVEVNAMDIYITQSNSYGLPIGAQIIVAHADASAKSYS